MLNKILFSGIAIFVLLGMGQCIQAQDFFQKAKNIGQNFSGGLNSGGKDSLAHRPANEDSLRLVIIHPDSYKRDHIDSSISELFWVYDMPFNQINLWNPGTAIKPIAFRPNNQIGLRMGYEDAFGYYLWNVKTIPYYQTDRPYSDLGYNFNFLGSGQQLLYAMHTQNIFPLWNVSIAYRSFNSVGDYLNQQAATNNLSINTHFETRNRHYQLWAAFVQNRDIAQENGGITNLSYLNAIGTSYQNRSVIPVNLGYGTTYETTIFGNPILQTGRDIRNIQLYLKHSYNIGQTEYYQQIDSTELNKAVIAMNQKMQERKTLKKSIAKQDTTLKFIFDSTAVLTDSLTKIKDSVLVLQDSLNKIFDSTFNADSSLMADSIYNLYTTRFRVFQSRFKIDHIFEYNNQYNAYVDNVKIANINGYEPIWNSFLNNHPDTIFLRDQIWQYQNQMAISIYPQFGNIDHYIKAGVGFDYFQIAHNNPSKQDLYVLGQYTDVTKNKKWVISLNGKIYLQGWHAGDYYIDGDFQRSFFNHKFSINLGVEQYNRSPIFQLQTNSVFYADTINNDWKRENTTHLYEVIQYLPWKIKLSAQQYFIANYTYFYNQRQATQKSGLTTIIQIELQKKFQILPWLVEYAYIGAHYVPNAVPVNIPAFYTIQRLAVETVFHKKFFLSAGIEVRYLLGYTINNYSPILGQFVYSNVSKTWNYPDINAFIHVNVRGVRLYFRAENVNTVLNSNFSYMNNTTYFTNYPSPNLTIRLGAFIALLN